ncbi:MAG: tRNA pseudouridine(38-40) synthase TruA [Candidatus Cloacimonetes bacterium]|nr:tRNA pseudouridine(38-40) synthase TruA [Candidatus Cloacimonadota bacterium]
MTPQRFLLRLAYDGSEFHGWQVQPGVRTVQEVIEQAVSAIAKQPVAVHGSGRTDTGVHATGQAAHIDWPLDMTADQVRLAIGSRLPPDVQVLEAIPVAPDFHARFDARERRYVYLLEERNSPFTRRFRSVMPRLTLHPERMKKLLPAFLGAHDFAAFCRPTPDLPHTRCELREFSLEDAGDHLRFTLRANRFLHNMVRRLVGCVAVLAAQDEGIDTAARLLREATPHPRLIPTAPPQGLYLTEALYPALETPGCELEV